MGGILGKNISIQLSPYAYTTKEDTYLHPRLKWTEKWNDNTQEQTGDLNNDSLNKMQTDYPNYLVLPEYPYSSVPTYLSTHYYDSLNDGFYINNNICSGSVLGKQGNIDHLPDHFEDNATQLIISTNLPVFINEEDARAWVNSGYSDTSKICNKYLEPADADSLLLRRNMMPNWRIDAANKFKLFYACDIGDGVGINSGSCKKLTEDPMLFTGFRVARAGDYWYFAIVAKQDDLLRSVDPYLNQNGNSLNKTGPYYTPFGHTYYIYWGGGTYIYYATGVFADVPSMKGYDIGYAEGRGFGCDMGYYNLTAGQLPPYMGVIVDWLLF